MRPEIVGVPSGSLRRVAPQMTTFRPSAIRMAQPARTSSSRTRTAAAHHLDKAAHVAGPRRQHHFYRYDPPHRSLIPLLLFDTNDGCVGLGRRGNPDADGRDLQIEATDAPGFVVTGIPADAMARAGLSASPPGRDRRRLGRSRPPSIAAAADPGTVKPRHLNRAPTRWNRRRGADRKSRGK